jgi:phosphoenolpyruvate synthase/pyruvate phosphate dikinase
MYIVSKGYFMSYIKWFKEIGIDDVTEVGGKMHHWERCTRI